MEVFTIRKYKQLKEKGYEPFICFKDGSELTMDISNGRMNITNRCDRLSEIMVDINPDIEDATFYMCNGDNDGLVMMRLNKEDNMNQTYIVHVVLRNISDPHKHIHESVEIDNFHYEHNGVVRKAIEEKQADALNDFDEKPAFDITEYSITIVGYQLK